MNTVIAIIMMSFLWQPGPDSLSLQTCYRLARQNNPMSHQLPLEDHITNLKTENTKKGYLPQLSLNGKATYQNDVTSVPIKVPGVTPVTISKDQYQAALNLSQPIYDGGNVASQLKLDRLDGKINNQSVEVSLYQIHNQVNGLYFKILLLKKNEASLDLMKKQLQKRIDMVRSQVKNGALLPGSQDALEAEMLKTEQSISGIESDKQAAYASLGELIGRDLSSEPDLQLPKQLIEENTQSKWVRPEYKLFRLQRDKLQQMGEQTKVAYRPHVSAFAEGMYGRPGLNIFKNEFQANYMVGIRASWKLWDWNRSKTSREVLKLQKMNVLYNQLTFTQNLKVAVHQELGDVAKYRDMMKKDRQIIKLREKVEQQSASQLHNGVITPTEYISDLYGVYQARLAMDQHDIQWMMAKINYLTKTGAL